MKPARAHRLVAGLFVSSVLACGMPPTPMASEPSVPRLQSSTAPTAHATAVLTGVSDPNTVVRLYVDDACAGPTYRQVSAEQLAEGVAVALLPGVESHFRAKAWNDAGLVSACSEPAVFHFEPQAPPRPPVLAPPLSLQGHQARVSIFAPDSARVQVWHSLTCTGAPFVELAPTEFARGVTLRLERGQMYVNVSAQGYDLLDQPSRCSSLTVSFDLLPPGFARLELASPLPTADSELRFQVRLGFDGDSAELFLNKRCGGASAASCMAQTDGRGTCSFGNVSVPQGLVHWSINAFDAAGNSRCFDAPADPERPLRVLSAPLTELEFVEEFGSWRLLVPARVDEVLVFDADTCTGAPRTLAAQSATREFFPRLDGAISVQGIDRDRHLTACRTLVLP